MGDIPQAKTGSQFENVLDVTGGVLKATPGKLFDEVYSDVTERPGEVAGKAAVSGVVGYQAMKAMTRFPKVGTVVALGLGAWQLGRYGLETAGFMDRARNADTRSARDALIDSGSTSLAREGTLLIETLPGAMAGSSLAVRRYGAPQIGRALAETRQTASEIYAFYGPGSSRIPGSLVTREGNVDLIKLAGSFGQKNPWTGVETAQSFDFASMRASRVFRGTSEGVKLPFADKPGRVLVHNHSPLAEGGLRMTGTDRVGTFGTGVIQSGDDMLVYEGQGMLGRTASRELLFRGATGEATMFESLGAIGKGTVHIVHEKPLSSGLGRMILGNKDITRPLPSLQELALRDGFL
ncbi:MAG: hypothetical protein IPM23_13325 [Candidatus Melainabacteria bacterium]|nr:hypothetical protein [Candidatus Melainabacteria bacterium]